MTDPINPDQTQPASDVPADETAAPVTSDNETPAFSPAVGDLVRLDDPEQDGEARYALYLGDQLVSPIATVQAYELPVYPAV